MLQKHVSGEITPSNTFLDLQSYMHVISQSETEKSNVVYLQVLDAKSDSKDTLMQILYDLHQRFIKKQNKEYLTVEGDAKLYEVLHSLKYEYGDELRWLLLYPGDWHTLKNYQIALMKAYFDVGLKDLAHAAGYPVQAIQTCSKFKRTHYFLLEAWEALYRNMLKLFLESTILKP